MIRDAVVQEVREAREDYARKFNYDLDSIFQDLKEQEKIGGRKVVAFPPKPRRPSNATHVPKL